MKLKSYFSGTVESAMDLARVELGDEALLVHARPTTPETRYLGAYEVVFGVMPAPTMPTPAPAVLPEPSPFRGEIDSLRRQIDRLTQSFEAPRPASPSPLIALQNEELDPEVARKISSGTPLRDIVSTDATLSGAVALVGPPGVGKTTTLIKLAARYGLARRKSVHILTTDVHRIAAADQLRSLAAILGIGCDVAETPGVLMEQLKAQKSRDLVLIDTPGFSLRELTYDPHGPAELAEGLANVDLHLVLSASTRPANLTRIIDAFDVFHPAKLLFTRLDETVRYGSLVNEAVRCNLPISFLSNGQEIPSDLEEATVERLSALVLGERPLLSKGAGA